MIANKEIISGIYKIELKEKFKKQSSCNGIYIGQSINIYRRWKAHINSCYNENSDSYNGKFYRAIRKYGIDSFDYKVLCVCDSDELDNNEIYYIDKYNSYKNGYNSTMGGKSTGSGENNPVSITTQKKADEMREYFKNNYINQKDLAKMFSITPAVVYKILNSMSYLDSEYAKNYLKPKTTRYRANIKNSKIGLLNQEISDDIRKYYSNNFVNYSDVSEKFNISKALIYSILNNNIYTDSEFAIAYNKPNGVRYTGKTENHYSAKFTQAEADDIRYIYKNNKIKVSELSKIYNVSIPTIRRILKGKTYKNSKYAINYKYIIKDKFDTDTDITSLELKGRRVNISELKERYNNGK